MTGALVVGGSHGEGLATCKDSVGAWSQPASISLSQGSIGLQAGAKSTDLVLFFQNQDAVSALKRGSFALGTEVSAVAGKYDTSLDASTAGVVVYSRTEGVYAGAAINESKIGKDLEEQGKLYGKSVDYVAILEGKEFPDSSGYSRKLLSELP